MTPHMAAVMTAVFLFTANAGHSGIWKDSLALEQLVYEIRDPQTDAKNFRRCLIKIGEYLAVDVMHELNTKEVEVQTLTGITASHTLCAEQPVLITILRAGMPLCLGVQKIFPDAEVGFFAMARNEETLKADTAYIALPDLKDKCVILVDTMIATGGSIIDAIKIVEKSNPRKIIVLGAIAAEPGIARIRAYYPNVKIYAAATDPVLNERGYIMPGLGDAGDRSYGLKK